MRGASLALVLMLAVSVSAEQTAKKPRTGPAPSLTPTGVPAPNAADAATIAEVLAFEKAMEAAVVRGDVQFLDRALSPDFIFTHGDGWTTGGAPLKVDTKASWLAYVAKQPPPYVYRELDHVQVELHGNVALTIGRYLYLPNSNNPARGAGAPGVGQDRGAGAPGVGQDRGAGAPGVTKEHLYVWFERVYVKQNGEWRHLSHRTVKGPVREADDVSAN